MALVGGSADDRVPPDALSMLAGVGLGTRIAIVAVRAVRPRRVGALAGGRVAHAGHMTLILGCTGPDTGVGTGNLTGLTWRAPLSGA
jgi:hypothetical protein